MSSKLRLKLGWVFVASKMWINGLEHFDLVDVAYLSLHSPILWNGSYDDAIDDSINKLHITK